MDTGVLLVTGTVPTMAIIMATVLAIEPAIGTVTIRATDRIMAGPLPTMHRTGLPIMFIRTAHRV